MECYACDQEATARCPRCGNAYCGEHGANLCAQCLDPAGGAPSGAVFRLSLFGLFAASVLALWLLVRPPSLPGETSAIRQPTAAPIATGTPGPRPSATPGADSPTGTPVSTPAPTPPPTAGPAGPLEYTVQPGDTLSGIASFFGVSAEDLAAVNGLEDADLLQPGDVLVIPQ